MGELTCKKCDTVHEQKEVGGLTDMVAHPSSEEVAKLLLPDLYEAPIAEVEHVERETESYVAWVVVLGFVAYAIALYWAHKCRRRGGDPSITFSALKGFGVLYTIHKHISHAHSHACEVADPGDSLA